MVVDVSPVTLGLLGALLTIVMQALKWFNLINDQTSDGAQRIVAAVLAAVATVAANYTVLLEADWSNPVSAVLGLSTVAFALWGIGTGVYHGLYKPVAERLTTK